MKKSSKILTDSSKANLFALKFDTVKSSYLSKLYDVERRINDIPSRTSAVSISPPPDGNELRNIAEMILIGFKNCHF